MIEVWERPPVYDQCAAVFGEANIKGAVFAYGDRIYNPAALPLTEDLIAHETVHQIQQEKVGGPGLWWQRYLADPIWRVTQEVEAYGMQWNVYCRMVKSQTARRHMLLMFGQMLSGPMYGHAIDIHQAMTGIARIAGRYKNGSLRRTT